MTHHRTALRATLAGICALSAVALGACTPNSPAVDQTATTQIVSTQTAPEAEQPQVTQPTQPRDAIPAPSRNEQNAITPIPDPGQDNYGALPNSTKLWQAKLIRVVDGDTITATINNKGNEQVTIRLLGINAPEDTKTKEPGGHEATQYLTRMLGQSGSPIIIEYDPSQGVTDKYNRTLAYVWTQAPGQEGVPATLTSTALVAQSTAAPYIFDKKNPDYHSDAIARAAQAAGK